MTFDQLISTIHAEIARRKSQEGQAGLLQDDPPSALVLLVDSISAVVVEAVATLIIEVVWHIKQDHFVDGEIVLAVPTS